MLPGLYTRQIESIDKLSTRASQLWTQCQRCQGSLHQPVLCTSQDCPIFYMRKKVQKDVKNAQSMLERFQFEW